MKDAGPVHEPEVSAPAAPAQAQTAPVAAVSAAKGERREERVKMTRLRQTIATRLKDAQNTAALLTTYNDVDMGRQLVAIGGVASGKGDDRLGFLHFADFLAQGRDCRLTPAEEAVEVQCDCLHPAVVFGGIERCDQVAKLKFPRQILRSRQRLKGSRPFSLFHQHPVQVHCQHTIADGSGPSRQACVEQPKEHEHEDEDEAVFDANQQFPHRTDEPHGNLLWTDA